jgi:DNA-binding transcriptional ArsR family regulator
MRTRDEQLDITFAALADRTRRSILARLATGEATVNELAEPFSISLQAVSKHLKVLERAGLITRGREAQWRPCRLEPEALDGASAWIDENRQAWENRLDALGGVIENLKRRRR